MDRFPFASTLLHDDGSLSQANTRWASEFPPLRSLAELLHPVDALRLRNAVRLHATLQIPVRMLRQGQWHRAQAFLTPQSAGSVLSLVGEPANGSAWSSTPAHAELLGGVVHSVNNYLSAMMGFSELALLDVHATHPAYGQLQTVLDSGQQAVQFTRDLLACAGRAVLEKRRFGLTGWLRQQMSQHDIPLAMTEQECAIDADPDWLARALAVALAFLREGEPQVLTAEFQTCQLSSAAASALAVRAGRYGVLCLRDRGRGLDSRHLPTLLQPYYSSKTVRGRKGLGLAPLEGIVRQHGGSVLTLAEANEGIAMLLLLPLMCDGQAPIEPGTAGTQRTAWLLTELPWLADLAHAQLTPVGIAVAGVNQSDAQHLLADATRPDLLLSWRLRDDGASAMLRQSTQLPLVIWTPFANHRPQTAPGTTLAKFQPDGELLRTAAMAALRQR